MKYKRGTKLTFSLFLLLFILTISSTFILAQDSDSIQNQRTATLGQTKEICQSCPDATFFYFSFIDTPTGIEHINSNISSTNGAGCINYTFNNLGRYDFHGSSDGCSESFSFYEEVTPSGNSGADNIVFFVFVILLLYTITFLGFFGRNIPITVLGGMSMLGLGIYTINNGIIIYRDWMTNYVSYVTMAIGAILALWALIEWIQDELG